MITEPLLSRGSALRKAVEGREAYCQVGDIVGAVAVTLAVRTVHGLAPGPCHVADGAGC